MAAWHFFENPELRARLLVAGEKERLAMLGEILRLEPVVGHLYRGAAQDLEVGDTIIREGQLMDLYVRAANIDESMVGPDPQSLCPGRDVAAG